MFLPSCLPCDDGLLHPQTSSQEMLSLLKLLPVQHLVTVGKDTHTVRGPEDGIRPSLGHVLCDVMAHY